MATPANYGSGSQGGLAARTPHGEKANGPEPPGPLRVLSRTWFSPAPILTGFLLNPSGLS